MQHIKLWLVASHSQISKCAVLSQNKLVRSFIKHFKDFGDTEKWQRVNNVPHEKKKIFQMQRNKTYLKKNLPYPSFCKARENRTEGWESKTSNTNDLLIN